jgi:protein-disulfide isomerase
LGTSVTVFILSSCNFCVPFFFGLLNKFFFAMQTIAEQFSVEAMPTFLFMKGGDVKDRVVGAVKEELEKKLELQMAQ